MHADSAKRASEDNLYAAWLESVGEDKNVVIRAIRELTGLQLGDAKALADHTPSAIQTDVSKAAAEHAKARLEQAGAQASIRPS